MTNPTFLNPAFHCTRNEFKTYASGLNWWNWKPKMPYLHNTGVPSLKQWQSYGSTAQERWGNNLNNYYKGMHWHAGPHIVCCPDYIWVLCELNQPGVAESCSNAVAFGIEMVGNYEVGGDSFSMSDGAKVGMNACFAIATMADIVGWGDLSDYKFNVKGLHFHRDCVQDHHACPGSLVTKNYILSEVSTFRGKPSAPVVLPPAPIDAPTKMRNTTDLQTALRKLGYPVILDGKIGFETTSYLRAFQHKAGIDADGLYGPETEMALEKFGV